MKRSTTLIALLAAGALATLGACQKTLDPSPNAGLLDPVPAPANNPQVSLGSKELEQILGFEPGISERRNGLLHVAVPMRNLTNNRYTLDYRFVFYDENGMELMPQMGYQEIILDPKEQRRPATNAPDGRAVAYRLHVKWANR
ncbi:MAG: YcfL family protein [Phycisphaerales bacterium JB050]